jgi:hypothetical protein
MLIALIAPQVVLSEWSAGRKRDKLPCPGFHHKVHQVGAWSVCVHKDCLPQLTPIVVK